ncbi:MAG: DUF1552 domain-containing protein [Zetaproteobacteria bacterium]|nr:DUF1552 domain-containing protein [Zetaproteobacteria bacterium]
MAISWRTLQSRRRFLTVSTRLGLFYTPMIQMLMRQADGAAGAQKFVAWFQPNGAAPDYKSFPRRVNGNLDFSQSVYKAWETQQFRKLKEKGIFFENIHYGGRSVDISSHRGGMVAFLTGRKAPKGGFGIEKLTWPDGPSIDWHIAQLLKSQHMAIHLDTRSQANESREVKNILSYKGKDQPITPYISLDKIHARIFGSVMGGNVDEKQIEQLRLENRSIFDGVTKDFQSLKRQFGQEFGVHVERHMQMVREIELARVEAKVTCEAPAEFKTYYDFQKDAKPTMDTIVAAMMCSNYRVFSLQWNRALGGMKFPWLDGGIGRKLSHHSLSHLPNDEGYSQAAIKNMLVKINTWYAEQLSYLAMKLENTADGGGTMLDNTCILSGSELAVTGKHHHQGVPLVVIGNGGGKIKSGQMLDMKKAPHNRLLATLAHVYGDRSGKFGDGRLQGDLVSAILK